MSTSDRNDREHPRGGETAPSAARRRVIRGIAGTAPVLLTVASRPALGAACTPSGFLSGNLSHHHDKGVCNGRSPGYWKTHFPMTEIGTRFIDEFATVWQDKYGTPWDTDTTLAQVLNMTGKEDRYEFGFHAVAALFNARYEPDGDYPMTEAEVRNVVNEVLLYGYYTDPVSGQTMDAEEVVTFFSGTFDV